MIGHPLYYFGRDEKLTDEFHRGACIKEVHQEMEFADESEMENLNALELCLIDAPVGVILTDKNYSPEGTNHV
jgi:hypothetical protein